VPGLGIAEEVEYPAAEFAKLDTFEGLNIEDGDKFYTKKDYNAAFAEYKAYSEQFPKGKALAYAILRMGRCKHMMKKREEAIRFYEEVVDYFPNDVRYAAGALYFKGLAQWENGDDKKAMATWAKMVQDKEYVKQANSGVALNKLADAMDALKEYEEAVEYRKRIALDFRKSNPEQAEQAKQDVRYHYIVRMPNHEAFMDFYREIGGFYSREDLKDLENSGSYWKTVLSSLGAAKGDSKESIALKKKSVPYWLTKLGTKFKNDDGMRLHMIGLQRFSDGDKDAWLARVLQQSDTGTMTPARLARFLGQFQWDNSFGQDPLFKKHGDCLAGASADELNKIIQLARSEYRNKLFDDHILKTLPGMDRDKQIELARFLSGVNMNEQAGITLSVIDLKGLGDDQLISLAQIAGRAQGEAAALKIFDRMKDKKKSLKAKYDWYLAGVGGRSFNPDKAQKVLELIDDVAKHPEWAEETKGTKANLLHRLGKYDEAIKAYKAWGKQPDATWNITECLISLKNYDQAVRTVQTLETVGGKTAVEACMKVADIYQLSGNKTKEVEQLRLVLHRYPGSGESSQAHQRLEAYGAKITGGKATVDK
jgi:TolA-binding protein